jgi:MOSC domain-containing protein YiiM
MSIGHDLTVHRTTAELSAALEWIRRSPGDDGHLELIVRRPLRHGRPAYGEREMLQEGMLTIAEGLVGDSWSRRRSRSTGRPPDPDKQITLINARLASTVAGDDSRRPLAGDQLFVDLDLSIDNLPPGSRVSIGEAQLEMTDPPHTGCAYFVERFGMEAMRFVNSPVGRQLRLRGAHARVVVPGRIAVGDRVAKVLQRAPAGVG